MPNWCSTTHVFCGSKENVQRLFESLEKIENIDRSKFANPATFLGDSFWLGYIKKDILGIEDDNNDIPCRGTIDCLDFPEYDEAEDEYRLRIYTETAWSPCSLLMNKVAEKFGLSMFYLAEEPGCLLYATNDKEGKVFAERYVTDFPDNGIEYHTSLNDVISYVKNVLPDDTEVQYELNKWKENELMWRRNEHTYIVKKIDIED